MQSTILSASHLFLINSHSTLMRSHNYPYFVDEETAAQRILRALLKEVNDLSLPSGHSQPRWKDRLAYLGWKERYIYN